MQLAQLLHNKRTDAALQMLSAEPLLAWIRDDESGGYPLHIAVWHVRRITLLLECCDSSVFSLYGTACSHEHSATMNSLKSNCNCAPFLYASSTQPYQDNLDSLYVLSTICTLTTSVIPRQNAELIVLLDAELAASNLTAADTVKHNRAA